MAAAMCGRVDMTSRVCERLLKVSRRHSSLVHQNAVVEQESQDLYPPVRPKFPEGSWGAMDKRQAWIWRGKKDKLSNIPSVTGRIDMITKKKMTMWKYKIAERYPRVLPYQQYATKTHLVKGLPSLYSSLEVDEVVKKIKPSVIDTLCLENETLVRDKLISKASPWERPVLSSQLMLKSLLSTLSTCLSADCDHLNTAQFDENVRVEAFWDRHGFSRQKVIDNDEDNKKFLTVDESRLQACQRADFVIRSENPLPEFLSRDDEFCQTAGYPELEYHPVTYGQSFAHKLQPSVVAGHWVGDPCEFGLLTVCTSNEVHEVGQQFGDVHSQQLLTGMGMNTSFTRLVAEAYYQGFSSAIDVTYPFTTQTILSDGQHFAFFAYQLNTLELWKDDDGNPLRNICWHTPEMKLYDSVEAGEVKGFNDNVLKHIVKFLLLKPGRPGVELRPSLPAGEPAPRETTTYINDKQVVVVVEEEEKYV
ncbi:28S ribosomal protein S30, mitochondrial-like [Haliotis rufescens]|uniref:28S ribosomal protein S30, mitochondrial-like n=1 Tax=Haliotis rufescens TaxID=6454 RepID=UPI00201ECF11|nr:28S ribosomal protein S30, mitochondrial-like [Haliotis rufescens]